MTIKSILVVTDLSAHEGMAVQRASQLADAHRANIKFVYLPARADKLEELVAQAKGMDLIVLPHRRDRSPPPSAGSRCPASCATADARCS